MPIAGRVPCPLCGAKRDTLFHRDARREYRRCPVCHLTFVPPAWHPSREEEVERYRKHRNLPEDSGYRAFLGRIVDRIAPRVRPGSEGLDYGSGPGPVLSLLLRERGFRVQLYDPFFAPDQAVLERTYDFVTCTETAEHFRAPGSEFERLRALLRPGGILALMTQVLLPERDFAAWHYIRDATHLCFYRPETLGWIADRFGWALDRPEPDIALFLPLLEGRGEGAGTT